MANAYWKTGTQRWRRKEVKWPSLGQGLQQLAIAAVIGLVWGGLLIGFLRLTDPRPPAQAEAALVAGEATPSGTPTPLPAETPTPTPAGALAESTGAAAPAESAGVEPSPPVTETPRPAPPPPDPPLPPADTPAPVEPPPQVSFSQDVFP
ncbi:MAG: hypothetical protein AB1801_22740, partial [Chloroflexota bacterium]